MVCCIFWATTNPKQTTRNHFFGGCLYCKHKGFETQVMCDFLMRLSTMFEVLVFFQRFALKVGNLYWQNKSFETKITNLFFPHCFVEISFFQTINLRFGSKKELLKFLRTYRVNKMVTLKVRFLRTIVLCFLCCFCTPMMIFITKRQ